MVSTTAPLPLSLPCQLGPHRVALSLGDLQSHFPKFSVFFQILEFQNWKYPPKVHLIPFPPPAKMICRELFFFSLFLIHFFKTSNLNVRIFSSGIVIPEQNFESVLDQLTSNRNVLMDSPAGILLKCGF